MKLWKSVGATFNSAVRHPRLWLLQFFGNVMIVVVFALWLRIPDAHWWELFFSFVIAVLLLVGALVLHGGTLNYCLEVSADGSAAIGTAFKKALSHLPAFLIWSVVFGLVLACVAMLYDYQYAFPGFLRSEFPAWLRRHVSEQALQSGYTGFVAIVYWILVPGLLLPPGLLCAENGFRGLINFRAWWRTLRNLGYWLVLVVAALVGVYCAGKIVGSWRLDPKTATLGGEEGFMVFRLLFAYLLMLFSWLWVCFMLGRATPHPEPPAASQKAVA